MPMLGDESELHRASLAKNAAAFFRMSRSACSLAFSLRSRSISSCSGFSWPWPGKACIGSALSSFAQRRSMFSSISRSRAACAPLTPRSRISRTASTLILAQTLAFPWATSSFSNHLFSVSTKPAAGHTSSSDENLERVRALGADPVIHYRQVPDWGKRVRDLTGGGVDHVVEVGGPGTLAQSITAVRVGGHISLIGVLTGRQGEVPTVDLMAKQARLQGLMVGSRRQQQDYVAALAWSGVRPVLDSSFPLDQLADAFRYQATGVFFGKVVVEW